MQASIVITTRNRKEELRNALRSCMIQDSAPEVIVVDDASDDGTDAMVRDEFPKVRLVRVESPAGYIVQRNLGAGLACGDVIFSIDDDAEFSSPDVVSGTLRDFEADVRIGAVAIPYIEPHKANRMLQTAPDNVGIWQASNFIGTAHAVRRDLFLELGGYREELVHQGEESDFCIRLLDAGHVVRIGTSSHIIHHESPKRNFSRMDYYGARNSVMFLWQNVPVPHLVPHLMVTTARCVLWSLEPARLRTRLKALWHAYTGLPRTRRQPVKAETYRRFMRLRKHGTLAMDDLNPARAR